MAVSANTSHFGKRELHRVWTDRRQVGHSVSVSGERGWLAIALLGLATISLGRWAALMAVGEAAPALPPSFALLFTLIIAAIALAALSAALCVLRALLRQGPVLRMDGERMVLRTKSADIALPWEDVSLSFGPLFLTIAAHPSRPLPHGAEIPREILVPVLLLPGGAQGLREAVRNVRPDALEL